MASSPLQGSYQGYSEHYHQQPEVYQYDAGLHPKPQEYSDPEAVRRQQYHAYQPANQYASESPHEKEQRRKICGLRVVTFWLALALVVVIIIAAVGGGVGGALAGNSSSDKSSAATTTTKTVSAPAAASSAIPSTGFGRLYCSNHSIYEAPTGARFKQYCAIDWAKNDEAKGGGLVQDITIKRAGTYHSCMNQCAYYNKKNPDLQKCRAISYDADLTETIGTYTGNCWFKSDAGIRDTLDNDYPERYAVAELLGD